MTNARENAWWRSPLGQLDPAQWEALCDGCGKCCLHKLDDPGTGTVCFTNVACRLLDLQTCRCLDYPSRTRRVADCLDLSPENVQQAPLPVTCAYRRRAEGRDLPAWHPLRSGDPNSVHASGNSILGRAISETDAGDLDQHRLAADGF